MRLHPVALSLILVCGVGVGTSYAAEGAVPGEPLYPVKIHVNESVHAALAISDEAKVDWSIRQVNRRLDEAETLAYRGDLDAEKRAEIEARIEQSADAFDTAVLAIADTPDPVVVANVAADFETSLSNRERALEHIAASPLASNDSVSPLIKRVRDKVEKAQRVRAVAVRFSEKDGRERARKLPNAPTVEHGGDPAPVQAALMRATTAVDESTTTDSVGIPAIETDMHMSASPASEIEIEQEEEAEEIGTAIEATLDFRAAILRAQGKDRDH